MATQSDLQKIGSLLYSPYNGEGAKYGFPEPPFIVWADEETYSSDADCRSFGNGYTYQGGSWDLATEPDYRNYSYYLGLCLGE